MNSLRIAMTELRRITGGRLPLLAVLALMLVPTLYAGLYLYANHDPYGRLDKVPAALVIEDRPADLEERTVHAGRDVADRLLDGGDFDWHEVDAAEAAAGVEAGRFDFALTIPTGFSQALTSPARFEPEQAQLTLTTNDANSYLSSTIANTVVTQVRDAIASQVSEEAADTFLSGLSNVRAHLIEAADGADRLADGAHDTLVGARRVARGSAELAEGATTLSAGTGTLRGGAEDLVTGLETLAESTSTLPRQTRALADGAEQVAAGNQRIAEVGREAATAAETVRDAVRTQRSDLRDLLVEQGLGPEQRQSILTAVDELGAPLADGARRIRTASNQLDRLAEGAQQVADGSSRLAQTTPDLVDGIGTARSGAEQLSTGAVQVDDGAQELSQGADELASGSTELRSGVRQLQEGTVELAGSLREGGEQLPAIDDPTAARIVSTLGDPVAVSTRSDARADSYGAGLAPFFLGLSAWIGGYVLFLLVRPLSTRAIAANQHPVRVAVGGWLTPALIGAAQMVAAFGVVTLVVGIAPADAVRTLGFMMLVSATFIAIVHALNAWLGAVGQFLGLVLLVLQLVTAGGTFPWQTIPGPLYPVHHVMPMSYAVDGLRQLMYGGSGSLVLRDVAVLLGWLLIALALSSWAAHRQRRWTPARIRPALTL